MVKLGSREHQRFGVKRRWSGGLLVAQLVEQTLALGAPVTGRLKPSDVPSRCKVLGPTGQRLDVGRRAGLEAEAGRGGVVGSGPEAIQAVGRHALGQAPRRQPDRELVARQALPWRRRRLDGVQLCVAVDTPVIGRLIPRDFPGRCKVLGPAGQRLDIGRRALLEAEAGRSGVVSGRPEAIQAVGRHALRQTCHRQPNGELVARQALPVA